MSRAASRAAEARPSTTRAAAERRPPISEVGADLGQFHIDGAAIPKGMRYEWKTEFVLGQHAREQLTQNLRNGWSPVPADRHPELAPPPLPGHAADTVIRAGGHILCERPEADCVAVERALRSETEARTRAKERELGVSADPANFPRLAPELSTTVEPAPRFEG
jgi:hypothetical protein